MDSRAYPPRYSPPLFVFFALFPGLNERNVVPGGVLSMASFHDGEGKLPSGCIPTHSPMLSDADVGFAVPRLERAVHGRV
eukprot:2089572-Rhodomonas_salina.4